MTVTLTGALHTIFPEERYGDFTKKVFWLKETEGKYPSMWQIELWHEDIVDIAPYSNYTGIVECLVEIKGRLWSKNGKDSVINILRCVGIKKV